MHLFQLLFLLLLLLVDYPKHLLNHLVVAIMTLTSTYSGIVQTICHHLDNAIAGIMIILNAVMRIDHNVK
jgi:phage-related holin